MDYSKIPMKEPVEITLLDFEKFGILYNMTNSGQGTGNVNHWIGSDWQDTNTMIPLIDTRGYLGHTFSSGCPFIITEMERHLHTQEALLPTNQPIVFGVAQASAEAPQNENIIPVILRPGYVAVLHRGTWHSSAHGLNGEGWYHYFALVYYNEPTVLEPITGGPLGVGKI